MIAIFSWYTYIDLLDIFYDYYPESVDMEWASYGLMLAIENSSHLKHSYGIFNWNFVGFGSHSWIFRFSKEMLIKLNFIRNKANAIGAIKALQPPEAMVYHYRFPFNDIMIDMELSSKDGSISDSNMVKYAFHSYYRTVKLFSFIPGFSLRIQSALRWKFMNQLCMIRAMVI